MAGTYYLYASALSENEASEYSVYGSGTMNDVFGAFDDDVGGYQNSTAFPDTIKRLTFTMTDFLPQTTGISSVTVGARMWNENGGWFDGEIIFKMGGTNYLSTFVGGSTGAYVNYEATRALDPSTSAAWTVAGVNALIAGCGWTSRAGTKNYKTTAVYARVLYAGAPALAPQARDVVSRRVFDLGANKALVGLTLPLEVGTLIDVMSDLPVSDWAGPHDSAAGWKQGLTEARLTKVYGVTVDPNTNTVQVQMRDRREALCLMQDSAWSTKSSSAEGLGIARFDKGCTRTHTRAGDAYVIAPGSLKGVKVLEDSETYGTVGQIHQRSATNVIIQSSFKNGAANVYTGWTKFVVSGFVTDQDEAGDGATDQIWEPISTGVQRSVKITQASVVGSGAARLESTASASLAANTKLRFSGWHKDRDQNGVHEGAWWLVRRGIDSFAWDDTAGAWVSTAGGTWWNQTPLSAEWARVVSKEIDVGGSATTVSVYVGGGGTVSQTTAIALQSNLWSHVQLEHDVVAPTAAGTWASTEILTETTTVTRNVSTLTISNNAAARCWNAAQGAFVCEVISQWSSAELANRNATIAWISFDASNWFWLGYDGTNDRFFAEIRHGGTTSRAFKAQTVVAGTVYRIGARWTGTNGELGLTPYTYSLFVDGVKGTDVVGGAVTETASSNLEIGSKSSLEHFNGVVRLIHSYQFVPTDPEMARLPT